LVSAKRQDFPKSLGNFYFGSGNVGRLMVVPKFSAEFFNGRFAQFGLS
jgi:hypothetical protein